MKTNLRKTGFAACLALLLLAGAAPRALAAERFADVPPSAWYASAVDYVSEAGLFAGVGGGNFAPKAPMTRAAEALGITAENYPRVAGGSLTLQTDLYRAMAEGEADLLLVPQLPEEAESLAGGLDLERVELGRSALVFYTCGENTAQGLTLDQAKEVYKGAVTSWQDLGGPERPLVALDSGRAQDDGRLQLERLVLRGEPVSSAARVVEAGRMLYFAALGHTFEGSDRSAYYLGYGRFLSRPDFPDIPGGALKALEFEGAPPTRENVAEGRYSLSYPYYAVYRADLPEGHPARRLAQWLGGPQGRRYYIMVIL